MTQRVAGMVLALEESGNGHGYARRLADHLLTAQEVDLLQIRPLALARAWDAHQRPVIELCLGAVKTGLLTLRWNLLCPRCRGAKATAATLDRLPSGAHCPSCNIDYGRDFTRNVELTFQPAPAIRPLTEGEYCLGRTDDDTACPGSADAGTGRGPQPVVEPPRRVVAAADTRTRQSPSIWTGGRFPARAFR